jgi:hypothetical protein
MAHHEHHSNPSDNFFLSGDTWKTVRNSLAFVALVGWVASIASYFIDNKAFMPSYLLAFTYFFSITLGAAFFVMVQHLTGSAWSVTVRRIMENVMRTAPVFLLLFLPVLFGAHSLYEWAHVEEAQKNPVLSQKLTYLNVQWFGIRGLLVIGLLSLFATILYRYSRKQDGSGDVQYTFKAERWSAPGLLVLFIGASVVGFDWVMSLEPDWYSTMFGVAYLSGGAVGFMALLVLICLGLRSNGYLTNSVNKEQYHDLGKWLFALMVFWAYVTFSQYMLIWYGNLPEEIVWFKPRFENHYRWLAMLLIFGNFIVPFFAMLPRAMKRHHGVLWVFASWMMVMHYVDLYWQIMPVFYKGAPEHAWMGLATLAAVGGTFGLVFWHGFRNAPLVPVGDPRLKQCLAFHNA